MKDFNDKEIQYVLIDCDPWADDFFALLWLLINHKFSNIPMEIVWITTVWWNVAAEMTYKNAFRVCEMLGIKDIPIWKDNRQITWEDASYIHWADWIGNLSKMLPQVSIPKNNNYDSVDLITDSIKKYWDKLIIVTLWPLTNLAIAESKNPWILQKTERIISMWWAINIHGNVTPSAEFNIFYDYESASKVFSSTKNIVLLPLDLTTSMPFTMEDMENSLKEINNSDKQKFMIELTKFIINTNMHFRETWYQKGFFIHDAHTIGFLLYPHLYKGSFMQVNIETKWDYTRWQTVVDNRNTSSINTNCFVALEFSKPHFLEAITQDFRLFDFK